MTPRPSGLPVPRFVSIKADRVNVRGGPDKDHDVAWIYTRVGWPVEITAEFENWRRIRDSDGSEGWVYHSLLSGKRMAAVQMKVEDRSGAALCRARCQERGDGAIAGRRDGGRSNPATARGATFTARISTAGSSRTICGASTPTRRLSNFSVVTRERSCPSIRLTARGAVYAIIVANTGVGRLRGP